MIWSQWWGYSAANISLDPEGVGVYELGDEDKNTVYYGSGFIKIKMMYDYNTERCPMAKFYRFKLAGTEEESKVLERTLLAEYKNTHGKLPIYNGKGFLAKISI